MKILAVDPGYGRLGVAVLEKNSQGKENLLYSACFETEKNLETNARLFLVGEEIRRIIKKYSPQWLAIENVYFNKNQKTALRVAESRGVVIYESLKGELSVREFGPQEIKLAVTGYGKSDKKQVADMVKRLLKVQKTSKDDEFDAIAVGLAFFAYYRPEQETKTKSSL